MPESTAAIAARRYLERLSTDPREPEESVLVRRAIHGDSDAFGVLYERYVDRVHRYIRVRVRDRGASRDLTQEVFVSALRGLPGLRREDKFAHWLFRIAHNTVRTYWQRKARSPQLEALDHGNENRGAEQTRPEGDPQRTTENRIEAQKILGLLDRLTEIQREVIVLRLVVGLSVHDTAEAMERSEDSVKKLQRRGLASLRRYLEKEAARPNGEDHETNA